MASRGDGPGGMAASVRLFGPAGSSTKPPYVANTAFGTNPVTTCVRSTTSLTRKSTAMLASDSASPCDRSFSSSRLRGEDGFVRAQRLLVLGEAAQMDSPTLAVSRGRYSNIFIVDISPTLPVAERTPDPGPHTPALLFALPLNRWVRLDTTG